MSRGWKVLLLTSVGVYLVAMDVSVVNVAFRTLVDHFGPGSEARLPWVFSAYNVLFAATLLTAGRAADRYGRKLAFLSGVFLFALGSLLCGLAPTVELLIAGRAVQAVGGALVMPASLGLVLPEFPVERRSAAIGVWGAIGGIAVATGPSVGAVLVDQLGWRWIFFFNVPLCVAAIFFGIRQLEESKEATRSRFPDPVGAAVGTAGIGLLTLAVIEARRWGSTSPRLLLAVVTAAVLLAVFIHRCRHHPSPVLDLTLFERRYFTAANAASFLFSMGFAASFFTNTQFVQGAWGYSVLAAGLAMTPGPLMAAATSAPAGRLAQKMGHRNVVVPGIALFCVGTTLLLIRGSLEANYLGVYLPAMLITGAGIGITLSTLASASNAYLPPDRFAMGSAFNTTSRQIGSALGIAAATTLRDDVTRIQGFRSAWLFVLAAAVMSAVTLILFYRRPTAEELAESDLTGRRPSEIEPVGVALHEPPAAAVGG